MSDLPELLSKLRTVITRLPTTNTKNQSIRLLNKLCDFLSDNSDSSDTELYTQTDLEIAIVEATASISSSLKVKELHINDLKRENSVLKENVAHLHESNKAFEKCVLSLTKEKETLCSTMMKHRKNEEKLTAQMSSLNRELEELKATLSMIESIDQSDAETYRLENSSLKSKLTIMENSLKDYKAGMTSMKKKIQWHQASQLKYQLWAEPESPMGAELDSESHMQEYINHGSLSTTSTTLTWTDQDGIMPANISPVSLDLGQLSAPLDIVTSTTSATSLVAYDYRDESIWS
jgi:hypothetical protein